MKTEKHFNWLVTMIADKVNFYPISQRHSAEFSHRSRDLWNLQPNLTGFYYQK